MQPRQDIVELFSTFVQFESTCFKGWATDRQLKRSMQQCLTDSQPTSVSESVWCAYWYNRWKTQWAQLAEGHLAAYLQESCYWAAQHILKKFESFQYCLPDYFQMAIADLATVLRDFNPDRGAGLKTYAAIAFSSRLRDRLRQLQEVDLCTPWTLLRKVSKKRFLEALHRAGLTDVAIGQYRLAWICFKTIYAPDPTRKLPELDSALWDTIAQLYNRERQSQLTGAGTDVTPAQIERWLTQCTTWVRAYLYPPVHSLNVTQPGQETGDRQDSLPDFTTEPLLEELIRQEEIEQRQLQRFQVQKVLIDAIAQLDEQSQTILRMHYQEGLTQQQIVKQVSLSQATLSRRLTRAREALLTALVQWSQQEMNNSVTPTLINSMGADLEEWLRGYYDRSAARLEQPQLEQQGQEGRR